ncbi:G-rich sequence factor 1 [Nibea albiflora]|uniref:G-rich sequence factor 1 n=1 Tax=Nibea albiflora TaxID=240163 RepID=A0ACB7FBD9_NIBAL|nr:G-rich sequence factor 1 [Nibea albiflora]
MDIDNPDNVSAETLSAPVCSEIQSVQLLYQVSEVTDSDAEVILKKAAHVPANDGVVRLRGLPFNSTESDIVHFFSGLDIVENGITIVTDHQGRNAGEAFVQFSSQQEANEAQQRDREVIGNRYIEVFPCRSDEIYSRKRSAHSAPPSPVSVNRRTSLKTRLPQSSPQSHYIHMRGLPFHASGEDVVEFFSPLVVSKILLECGSDGRSSGEADVYFRCHQDAMAAMSKDRQHIGERYIELFLNSVPECDGR